MLNNVVKKAQNLGNTFKSTKNYIRNPESPIRNIISNSKEPRGIERTEIKGKRKEGGEEYWFLELP